MKGQKLTLATLLVIVIGVIVVALLTIGIWFGYQSVAAKYGWHPPSGPNFGNLALPPYTIEVGGVDEITHDGCLNLVESGVVDKGKFRSAEDYCKIYCPFKCYKVDVVVYSYLYNQAQDVIIDLYANTSNGTFLFGSHRVHLDTWNGNMENGKSTTKATTIFFVPIYESNDCNLNLFIFNSTNGEYNTAIKKEPDKHACVLCGCRYYGNSQTEYMPCNLQNFFPCPYVPGTPCAGEPPECDEGKVPCCKQENEKWVWKCVEKCESEPPLLAYDSIICKGDGNCTMCNSYCKDKGFEGGFCTPSFGATMRCTPTDESSYDNPSEWPYCVCYYESCPGECKNECDENEIGRFTRDCFEKNQICCIRITEGGGPIKCRTSEDCSALACPPPNVPYCNLTTNTCECGTAGAE